MKKQEHVGKCRNKYEKVRTWFQEKVGNKCYMLILFITCYYLLLFVTTVLILFTICLLRLTNLYYLLLRVDTYLLGYSRVTQVEKVEQVEEQRRTEKLRESMKRYETIGTGKTRREQYENVRRNKTKTTLK